MFNLNCQLLNGHCHGFIFPAQVPDQPTRYGVRLHVAFDVQPDLCSSLHSRASENLKSFNTVRFPGIDEMLSLASALSNTLSRELLEYPVPYCTGALNSPLAVCFRWRDASPKAKT